LSWQLYAVAQFGIVDIAKDVDGLYDPAKRSQRLGYLKPLDTVGAQLAFIPRILLGLS
jgi:hypothetical protein